MSHSKCTFISLKSFVFYALLGLLIHLPTSSAFAQARTFYFPDLNRENFLDLHSYRFRPDLQRQWYQSNQGWRIAGGSLDLDFLYVQHELRFRTQVNDQISFGFHLWEESFFGTLPLRQQLEMEVQVLPEISIIVGGIPAYEKRNADMGFGFRVGTVNERYFKWIRLEQDPYFNDKTFGSDLRYRNIPIEDQFQALWTDQALFFYMEARVRHSSVLESKKLQQKDRLSGSDGKLFLSYDLNKKSTLVSQAFWYQQHRSFKEPNPAERKQSGVQDISWMGMDVSWQTYHHDQRLSFGGREDLLHNLFRERVVAADDIDYQFQTTQVYGSWYMPWKERMAWEYELQVGRFTEESNHGLESKLRVSWEYQTTNGAWLASTTWNMDNLFQDFWDGGHLSYQVVF